ncbi:hypothetical protein A2U01_0106656, partial [Trifolium medium]|nr:hypothetical protein [Trifolium medium]
AQARLQEAGLVMAIAQRATLDGATRGVACSVALATVVCAARERDAYL